MKTNANELRTMVMENAFTLGRLNKDTIGASDYKELTDLYATALDAITEWASADYEHKSTQAHSDLAFEKVKAVLSIFATEEDRIIIDLESMRTLRDFATKPRRQYSAEYKKAHKAYKDADKTVKERYADLLTLGAPERKEEETVEDYATRVRDAEIKTEAVGVDMLQMFINASAVLTVKAQAVEDVKARGNWTWKRPVAVAVGEFGELVENYIADCLTDGYNIKPSSKVRAEKAEALAAAKKAKAEAKATA